MEFIKKPVFLLLIIIAMNFGVKAVAWTLPINSIIELILNNAFSVKITGYRFSEQLKDIVVPLLLSIGIGIASFIIGLINISVILGLALQVIVGILVYIALSAIFKVDEFNMLLDFIKLKTHR